METIGTVVYWVAYAVAAVTAAACFGTVMAQGFADLYRGARDEWRARAGRKEAGHGGAGGTGA